MLRIAGRATNFGQPAYGTKTENAHFIHIIWMWVLRLLELEREKEQFWQPCTLEIENARAERVRCLNHVNLVEFCAHVFFDELVSLIN